MMNGLIQAKAVEKKSEATLMLMEIYVLAFFTIVVQHLNITKRLRKVLSGNVFLF